MVDVKLFIRSLWRNKLYSVVTVFGFAMALTFVILLGAYIRQELSVDRFFKNKELIFRAVCENGSTFGALVGKQLKNEYPEIECYTRLSTYSGFLENDRQEKINYEALLVDAAFFRMFSFSLLEGDPADVFPDSHSVVLTRSYAERLFEGEEAVGKEFIVNDERVKVTGIMEDMPVNTHFPHSDILFPFDFIADLWGNRDVLTNNNNASFGLYVMVYPGTDLLSKAPLILENLKKTFWLYQDGYVKTFEFERLTDVYWNQVSGNNSKTFVLILAAIAVIVLLLAAINYNNLSMARVGFRAKEAAIKKLLGITDRYLFLQFVSESIILCFIAFVIAMLFAGSIKPWFDQVLHTQIALVTDVSVVDGFVVFFALTLLGFISGIVPALTIVHYNPIEVVKGSFRRRVKGTWGKILIGFQYMVSMVLIIVTLLIFRQTDYLRNYDPGFDKKHVISMENRVTVAEKEALRSELMRIPGVRSVSFVCGSPLDGGGNTSFIYEGKSVSFQVFKIDTSFLSLMSIGMRPTANADLKGKVYLNEAAVKELGLEALPTTFKYFDTTLLIAGIVDNFHFEELTEKVSPAILMPIGEDVPWNILVKVEEKKPGEIYRNVRNTYSRFIHDVPFESGFLDSYMDRWYDADERTARLIGYFSVVSVILALMGILAMATYYVDQRTKEIAIRRVHGASINKVLETSIAGFIKWIFGAFVLACPIAWLSTSKWLEKYPYHIDIEEWVFVMVGLGVVATAFLTIGWQIVKAAARNPVHALKSE